jgi:hypothetical protein
MPSMFPLTLGAGGAAAAAGAMPPEVVFNDPYAAQIAEMQARLAKPQQSPMFTPEQVQQRRADNDRQYQLGILGQLSGDQGLGDVGGRVLQQALAARAPRITEKGVADPITGQFNYDPDYLRQRDEGVLTGLQNRSAAARANFDSQRAAAADRLFQKQQHDENLRAMQGAKGEALIQVQMPDGSIQYVPRSQAAGMQAPPRAGAGNASEGERNAAGFAAIMRQASGNLDRFERNGLATRGTQALMSIPLIGDQAARAAMTPAQQQYDQAARAWVRAKLRKESGASIGVHEMEGEIATFFPQPGEGPAVREQKRQARELANRAMESSAGRAAIPSSDLSPVIDVGAALGAAPASRTPAGAARPQALPKANPKPAASANRLVDGGW